MADFGGVIRFTYNGTPIRVRASRVNIDPTNAQYDVEHNQDGSFDRYAKPMGPGFDIEFVDSVDGVNPVSLNWDAIMSGGPYNISVIEDTNKILHTFTAAKFYGRPQVDRLKGVVTGMKGQCAVGNYTQTQTA